MNKEQYREISSRMDKGVEEFKEICRKLVKVMCNAFEEVKKIMLKVIEQLDFSNPKFKHDWNMAIYAKKKRTRKKYAKKCLK